ncbi:NINE protein [Roseibium suaedae]|uniref:TM2 domain-containing protein n=1 Tax=Roseibium suaedae TaxID=735517 RepID=A0A1M7LAV0_9HYPH|nr:TM2 domain-containing protein [Roseibium suaedae]SHM75265.1 TM2 domain-containing protein [Roseibium suaedae]
MEVEQTGGWNHCSYCGKKIAMAARACPECGAPQAAAKEDVSPKSYGVAVALCGVFGMVGIHHFYLGNILHGLFDLGLFLCWFLIWVTGAADGNGFLILLAVACFIADFAHTLVIFTKLICGSAHDSQGRRVAIPGHTG